MEHIEPHSLEFVRQVRNNLLIKSDVIVSEIEDETELARWLDYRQKLRDFLVGKEETYFANNKLVWPRTPKDVDSLKEAASRGDAESIEIVQREGL